MRPSIIAVTLAVAVSAAGCSGTQTPTVVSAPTNTPALTRTEAKAPSVPTTPLPPSSQAPGLATPAATAGPESLNGLQATASNPPIERQAVTPAVGTPLPPQVGDVIKLAQSGVGDSVLVAYIESLNVPRDLTADEVVYLRDVGLSQPVLTALIQRRTVVASAQRSGPAAPAGVVQSVPAPLPPGAPASAGLPPAPSTPPNAVAVAATAAPPAQEVVQQPVTTTYFYETLSPYGIWVDLPGMGWCWRPTVATVNVGWRPYCDNGRWIWTDSGWYWHSEYSWGWAPFHYGRWHHAAGHGWVWMPDTVWGPAWVTWRRTDSHCGWAPLPPAAHWNAGVGLTFHNSSVSISFGFGLGLDDYCFVPYHGLYAPSPRTHLVQGNHAAQVYNNSTVINNYVTGNNNTIVNGGISADRISAITRTEIPKVTLRDGGAKDAVGGRALGTDRKDASLAVYRPQIPAPAPRPPETLLQRQGNRGTVTSTVVNPGRPGGNIAPGTPPASTTTSVTPQSAKPTENRGLRKTPEASIASPAAQPPTPATPVPSSTPTLTRPRPAPTAPAPTSQALPAPVQAPAAAPASIPAQPAAATTEKRAEVRQGPVNQAPVSSSAVVVGNPIRPTPPTAPVQTQTAYPANAPARTESIPVAAPRPIPAAPPASSTSIPGTRPTVPTYAPPAPMAGPSGGSRVGNVPSYTPPPAPSRPVSAPQTSLPSPAPARVAPATPAPSGGSNNGDRSRNERANPK